MESSLLKRTADYVTVGGWRMHAKSTRMLCLLTLATTTLVGCGDKPETAPFTGKVVYNEEPLEFGNVMFQPVGGGHSSTAQIQPDGSFTMQIRDHGEGAQIGANKVRITCYPAQDQRNPANSGDEIALGDPLIPRHYGNFGTSGLTVEVPPEGVVDHVFELSDD